MEILAEITNILNLEIKNLNIKLLEIDEEKKRMEIEQKETAIEVQKEENSYKEKIQQIEDTLSKKQEHVINLFNFN